MEGSECCLIHADNPLSGTSGVWVNPRVRVGYSREAYVEVNKGWEGIWGMFVGVWKNRLWRWVTPTVVKAQRVRSRMGRWRRGDKGRKERTERGVQCLINEMQVLAENGWAHV